MKIFKLLTILTILFSVAMTQSCGDDANSCDTIVCLNDGICDNGTCACEPGYEGTLCATLSRAKLIGSYTYDETCDSNPGGSGTGSIVADASADAKATINAGGSSINITMTGVNSFSLPEQTACTGCDLIESGSGSVENEGVIEMQIIYASGETCNSTLTPQ